MEINFLHKCSSHQTNQKLKKKTKKTKLFYICERNQNIDNKQGDKSIKTFTPIKSTQFANEETNG